MAVKVRLSDEAYSNLIQQAKSRNYIRVSGWTRGLGEYLTALSQVEFTDNRPDYIKEWKPQGFDMWCIPDLAVITSTRFLGISQEAIDDFALKALLLNILRVTVSYHPKTEALILHFKKNQTPIMLASAMLEAIGTNLLIPNYVPTYKQWVRKKPLPKPTEFYW